MPADSQQAEMYTQARRLLDTISGVPLGATETARAAALSELTGLLWLPGLNAAVLEMLLSGVLFRLRSLQDSDFVMRIIRQVKAANDKASLEDIDAAAFFPERAGKALEKLTDIPADLFLPFKQAAPEVFAGLSVEELTAILLSGDTPGWLVKLILNDKRLLDIIGQSVCAPYSLIVAPDGATDERKEAELDRTVEQARKALEWMNKCPAEYLPVSIAPCPLDLQECVAGRLAKELEALPPDKLLTLAAADYFPAWLCKAAENAFARRAADGTDTTRWRRAERKKRRQKKTDSFGR